MSNGPLSGTARMSRYQKGKTNLDSTEARDSEWQWHQLSHMQVCTSLQANNHKHYINHNRTLFTLTFRSVSEAFLPRHITTVARTGRRIERLHLSLIEIETSR